MITTSRRDTPPTHFVLRMPAEEVKYKKEPQMNTDTHR